MKETWTEKYRPKTLDEYVFIDEKQKTQVNAWVKDGMFPSLLLSGSPGTGKTTLAKVLINELGINEFDILIKNASRDNDVAGMKSAITGFVSTMPFGDFKVVLLDEADYLSHNAQAVLRGLIEEYDSTARFILTCNYKNKILPALIDRLQGYHIENLDIDEFIMRAYDVLIAEKVEFDIEVLKLYVKASYPSLRNCLKTLQKNTIDGKLTDPEDEDSVIEDYKVQYISLMNQGKTNQARKVVCSQVRSDEVDGFFRWAYDNLSIWCKTEDEEDEAICIICEHLVNHALVADFEINLSALLCKLGMIK